MAKASDVRCPVPSRWVTGLASRAPEVLQGALRNGRFSAAEASCVKQALSDAEAQRVSESA